MTLVFSTSRPCGGVRRRRPFPFNALFDGRAPRIAVPRLPRLPSFFAALDDDDDDFAYGLGGSLSLLKRRRLSFRKDDEEDERDVSEFKTSLAVAGYSPDDVEVSVDARTVTVSAKKEDISEGYSMVRRFKKSFVVPEDCDMQKLEVSVAKGVMTIRAPNMTEEEGVEAIGQDEAENGEERMETETAKEAVEEDAEQTAKEVEQSKAEEKEETDNSVNPSEAEADDKDNFKASVNVSGFGAEDVRVEVVGADTVVVTAEREEEVADAAADGARKTKSSLRRELWVDAEKFDLESLKSGLNDEGFLLLEAKRRATKEAGKGVVRDIPVIALE